MLTHLHQIKREFTTLIVFTFLITPVINLWAASVLGLITLSEIVIIAQQKYYLLFSGAMLLLILVHFWKFLDPIVRWAEYDRNNQDAPIQLYKRLRIFTEHYWGFFVFYACITPLLINLILMQTLVGKGLGHSVSFISLQLLVSYLIALPAYLFTLDKLGQLVRFLGLQQIYHGLKSRLFQVGAVVPLICMGLLAAYHFKITNEIDPIGGTLLVLMLIVVMTATFMSVRSLKTSLLPVQEFLGRSGASTHADLAKLKPCSTDEIGYLMQSISGVFKRFADQQSHMHAVVDNAAEGIIVIDSKGIIETFNQAAEKLFGHTAHEARGKLMTRMLPGLFDLSHNVQIKIGEQELEGLQRNGRRRSMSVRVSEVWLSDKLMYTCLVADITDRKAAQIKQKNAEARYRDLVETAHDLVWSMDAEGHWTYLNKAAFTIYGREPIEMIGMNISEFRDPDYAAQESIAFQEILRGKELFQFETVHLDTAGHAHYLSFNAKAQCDVLGNVQKITGTARDISEKKAFEKQLTYQAEHDVLTGLFNRRYFQKELERVTARMTRSAGSCGLLYIDLDQFKYVNDTLGHAAGDKLLVEISKMLLPHVREGELLSRFGGDEFTLLLYNISAENLSMGADKFRKLFEDYRFLHEGNSINVTCSIGATLIDSQTNNADDAMAHADLACHIAKSRGRNCINIYDKKEGNENGMAADMGWAARVREMLDKGKFLQVYQPIVSVKTGLIHDYEVLIRMPCDDGQIVLPGGFLPAAERFGLIQHIDRWVVEHSIRNLHKQHQKGNKCRFAINLSGHAFEDRALLPTIRQLLKETNVDPSAITFEITESAAIKNLNRAVKLIEDLREIGCQFSLDDFGSGFNSFTYLKHLPVDIIKIDGSFVKGVTESSVDFAMVTAINQVAHALNKKTVAEYVENRETLFALREIGVDFVQGNYLGKPEKHLMTSERLPDSCTLLSA
ncbi:diguanylate cyclase/phosphodiesterase (GGDEF & EAL domains) with PAS/PAC sensor(s) [hydrothermal vent metagenome]|uniref:Diguanylate cyclase/phosphodiesterase (GGDEF & EAL domains) with PAS/PAC sensor(S) n=1 Tax=hydrothermal vent metagenome TaxID=652676 RepID=A0A3B0YXV1_9ZZZZ